MKLIPLVFQFRRTSALCCSLSLVVWEEVEGKLGLLFSHSVVSDSLQPCELQHAKIRLTMYMYHWVIFKHVL